MKNFCYLRIVIWIKSIIMGATVKNSQVNGMIAVKAVVVKETTFTRGETGVAYRGDA